MSSAASLWEAFLQTPMYYTYWGVAIAASVVFVIQILLLFIGFDTDVDFSGGDVSFDIDGLSLVSVKTVACFLLGFGWTGVLFWPIIGNAWLLALIALTVGVLFMLGIAFLLRQVLCLSQDATFRLEMTLQHVADVYLRIVPGDDHGGKIIVSIDGAIHELQAVSCDKEEIPTGAKVRIVEVVGDTLVRVERI